MLLEYAGEDTNVPWVDVRFVDHGPIETPRNRGISLLIERELQLGLHRELARALRGYPPHAVRYVVCSQPLSLRRSMLMSDP